MVSGLRPLTLWLSLGALAVSAAGVRFSIRLAHRMGWLDTPNARSSHSTPMPRTGGVAMVTAACLSFAGWVLLSDGGRSASQGELCAVVFAILMAALGFWDDLSGLSPLFRFLVQLAGATMILAASPGAISPFAGEGWIGHLWIPAGVFWIVWMLNQYNFMDGIDGLAGGEAVVAGSYFFLLFARFGEPEWAAVNILVAAAAAGFLIYNWSPARVFMGDAGSMFLGAFFGMQSVLAAMATTIPFPVLVLPFANFLLDTTATLIHRLWRKEKWFLAHRSHYYQRMTRLGMSHGKVTGIELIAAALSCGAAEWYLRAGRGGRAACLAVVLAAFAAAGSRVRRMERGRP